MQLCTNSVNKGVKRRKNEDIEEKEDEEGINEGDRERGWKADARFLPHI